MPRQLTGLRWGSTAFKNKRHIGYAQRMKIHFALRSMFGNPCGAEINVEHTRGILGDDE